jgi:hypothetical protein
MDAAPTASKKVKPMKGPGTGLGTGKNADGYHNGDSMSCWVAFSWHIFGFTFDFWDLISCCCCLQFKYPAAIVQPLLSILSKRISPNFTVG